MMEIQTLVNLLHTTKCSCVIGNNEIRTFTRPGIIDLYDLAYNDRHFLSGASIADKIVGKGAAGLMIVGGIKKVHADVISNAALTLLKSYNVEVEYDQMASFIWNRTHTDLCPLEKLCADENDPVKILEIIDKFLSARTS